MALFNYASKEITLKVVYYGPGLSGKTTNLQYLHPILDKEGKSKLISLATESDRTLFFDFMPITLGKIKDFCIRFQLYTVPGQVRYNATRKLVLKGADAVVFVADSQKDMREQNIESLLDMRENLTSNNIDPDDIPVVLQYNKRDLNNIFSIEELNRDLNTKDYSYVSASAIDGTGVEETFQLITKELMKDISKKHRISIAPMEEETAPSEAVLQAPVEVPITEELPEEVETLEEEQIIELREQALEIKEPTPQINEKVISDIRELLISETTEVMAPEIKEEIAPRLKEEIPEIEQEILRASIPEEAVVSGYPELEGLKEGFFDLQTTVSSIKDAIERLSKDAQDSRAELSLKSFSRLSSLVENSFLELSREIKELKAKQTELSNAIKEIHASILGAKVKKKWGIF
ncbi:MAG: GTPase domain-containing protein [Nitrospirae bacterium]|nr:GTPase domain-containing protein [Nitrospirota bacterium]